MKSPSTSLASAIKGTSNDLIKSMIRLLTRPFAFFGAFLSAADDAVKKNYFFEH